MFSEVKKNGGTVYGAKDEDVKLSNDILAILNRDKNLSALKSIFNSAKTDIMAMNFGIIAMGLNVFSDDKNQSNSALEAIEKQRKIPEVNVLCHILMNAFSNKALRSKVEESESGRANWAIFDKIDQEIRGVVDNAASTSELKGDILDNMQKYPRKSLSK